MSGQVSRQVRRAPRNRLRLVVAAAVVFGVGASSCGGGSLPQVAVQSPVNTAFSWFKSINEHDMSLALAHFSPADRDQMRWSHFGSYMFTHVLCELRSQSPTASAVRCSFQMPNPPLGMDGVTFWDIYMDRKPPGPWLITAYGQG